MFGGIGVAALLGYKLYTSNQAAATPAADTTPANPATYYATGFGANTVSAGGIPSGSTADGSFAALANAMTQKSNNDLSLGLASIDLNKTIGLATIGADLQTSLTDLGNARLHDAYTNIPLMQANGLSAIQAFVGSNGQVSSQMLYTDPSKNTQLVNGQNAGGDTTTTFGTINKQSSATQYNMGTYTDIHGVLQNNSGLSTSSTTPAPVVMPALPIPTLWAQGNTKPAITYNTTTGKFTNNGTVM